MNTGSERTAIQALLARPNARSPITREALSRDLHPNRALQTMIREWNPGRQSVPSVLETRSAVEIANHVVEEFRRNAVLLNSAKGQHIVAFLGNT